MALDEANIIIDRLERKLVEDFEALHTAIASSWALAQENKRLRTALERLVGALVDAHDDLIDFSAGGTNALWEAVDHAHEALAPRASAKQA